MALLVCNPDGSYLRLNETGRGYSPISDKEQAAIKERERERHDKAMRKAIVDLLQRHNPNTI